MSPCAFPGCGRHVMTKGLCTGHYQQRMRGVDLRPLMKRRHRAACAFAGCDKPHRAHGYCFAHYAQVKRGQPLRPLGWHAPSPIALAGDRVEVVLFDRDGNESGRAVVDAADAALVADRRWSLSGKGYATTHAPRSDRNVYMHRLIFGGDSAVDHVNGHRLDNRRCNLRAATPGENCQNAVRPGRETMRNVYHDARSRRRPWYVRAQLAGRAIFGGAFATREEAIAAARALRATVFTHANEARHASEVR